MPSAPWADNPTEDWEATAPPLLKRLRGDWVCLPFGLPGKPRTDLDADWLEGLDANLESPDPAQHGACSNANWRLEKAEPHALTMSFAPDAKFPISRIERRISAADGDPAIDVETRIAARAACELQWGVHPTFRLPEEPGAFEIGFGGDVTAFTYPGFFEAGVSRVAHGRTCAGIGAVPMLDGSVQSFAALPLPFDTEELLLVAGHKGVARLTNRAEGYRVVMEWDPRSFRACCSGCRTAAAATRRGTGATSASGSSRSARRSISATRMRSIRSRPCAPGASRPRPGFRRGATSRPATGSGSRASEGCRRIRKRANRLLLHVAQGCRLNTSSVADGRAAPAGRLFFRCGRGSPSTAIRLALPPAAAVLVVIATSSTSAARSKSSPAACRAGVSACRRTIGPGRFAESAHRVRERLRLSLEQDAGEGGRG